MLLILLIGLVYYRFVHITVIEARDHAKAKAAKLQTEVDLANTRLLKIKKMEEKENG